MVKVAFCDDDAAVLHELGRLLDQYRGECHQEVVYTAFNSPFELMSEIEKGMQADIIFLDVIMPGENGIEVAREIREHDENVKIIFLTSSAEFAVQSYTVGAYFYQLKPIWKESLYRLLDSVISECKKEHRNSLIMRCKTGITRIELDKLEYCEVIGRTLLFHMENGMVVERNGRLDELCEQLAKYDSFLRPHRSYLVNMEYIRNISYKAITMESQAEIPIPRGKYTELKDIYLKYAFSRKQVFYCE